MALRALGGLIITLAVGQTGWAGVSHVGLVSAASSDRSIGRVSGEGGPSPSFLALLVPPAPVDPEEVPAFIAHAEPTTVEPNLSSALELPGAQLTIAAASPARLNDPGDVAAVTVPLHAYGPIATLGLGMAMCYGGARWLRLRR